MRLHLERAEANRAKPNLLISGLSLLISEPSGASPSGLRMFLEIYH